jgi:osmotically-inducible protein OsmY
MKLKSVVVAVLAASGAALGVTAHAQQNDKFTSLDRDRDGFLSKGEVSHMRGYDRAFDQADGNRDGKLDADEFIKAEAIYDRQQVGGYVGDTALTAKVKTALLRERGLKSKDVHVETDTGRVLLSGWVDSEAQRDTAVAVARRVDGVTEVKDGLTVR